MKANARECALQVLIACRKNNAWADAALKSALKTNTLSAPDAALCSRIVYGVMQNKLLLDFYIGAYCSQKPDHLQPPLLDILRIGVYQILFLDKVPDRAAVNEAVTLAKSAGRAQASGLVNAVLRKISQNQANLPQLPEEAAAQLSIRYSHPAWLVERLLDLLGAEQTEAFLRLNNETAPMTVQVNPLKTTAEALARELADAGVSVRRHAWVPDCLELSGTGDLTTLPAFYRGYFTVQDAAAKLAVCAAGCRRGDRVLDVCAAPGGKSFAAAFSMENEGTILSCDLHENKLKRIRKVRSGSVSPALKQLQRTGVCFAGSGTRRLTSYSATCPAPVWASFAKSPTCATRMPPSLPVCPKFRRRFSRTAPAM